MNGPFNDLPDMLVPFDDRQLPASDEEERQMDEAWREDEGIVEQDE